MYRHTFGQDILENCTIGQKLLESRQNTALRHTERSGFQGLLWTKYALLVRQIILEVTSAQAI